MPTRRRRRLTRRDVDVRLGYAGLGVGALTVVLVLVASLVVIEVAPRVDLPGALTARQTVVRYPALESLPVVRVPARTGRDRSPDQPRTDRDPVQGSPTPDESVTTDDRGWDTGTGGGTGGGTPGHPGTPAPGPDGAVSQVVDPVVDDLTGTLDQTTGGATAPVTGPAGGLVDGVTDLADDLLDQP